MTDVDAFATAAIRQIQNGFTPDDPNGSMTGAKVGMLLRSAAGLDYQLAGYPRLKDLLAEFEQRGWIKTGVNSKGAFAVWLPRACGGFLPPPPTAVAPRPRLFRRLRQHVWRAFVAEQPAGQRWMHRTTGEVRLGLTEAPDSSDAWVELQPVDPDVERAESQAFLEGQGIAISEAVVRALASPTWFVDLPRELEQSAALRWKRHRTARIAEHAENWRQQSGISESLVYNDDRPRSLIAGPPGSPARGEQLRLQLLAAIERLGTDQLLSLALPARHLVEVLRPDLLR